MEVIFPDSSYNFSPFEWVSKEYFPTHTNESGSLDSVVYTLTCFDLAPVQQLVDPRIVLSLPGLVRPLSRGWVKLAGADPSAYPRINPNYFGEPADLDRMTMMVKMARDIYATKAFTDDWQISELAPGPQVTSDTDLAAWVVDNVGSYYHFAGSCKMGTDELAVVDPQLRVRGVEGLRVADASIMPAVTSTNPHTTVVMIGERAADLVQAGAGA